MNHRFETWRFLLADGPEANQGQTAACNGAWCIQPQKAPSVLGHKWAIHTRAHITYLGESRGEPVSRSDSSGCEKAADGPSGSL